MTAPVRAASPTITIIARCQATDPGPTRSGSAYLEATSDGRINVLRGWYLAHSRQRFGGEIEWLRRQGGFFVLETIRGQVYNARRTAQLFETKEVEGRMAETCEANGLEPVRLTAPEWRQELCGDKSASDEQVRLVVELICGDEVVVGHGPGGVPIKEKVLLPSLSSDHRAHVYDAIGLGIVALSRALKMPLRLPAYVLQKLDALRASERGHRKLKKQLAEAGVKMPRKAPRKLTVWQRKAANEKAAATRAAKGMTAEQKLFLAKRGNS